MGCIYILTSPSGKVYIGQTIGCHIKRFKGHCHHAKIGRGCPKLSKAILKYGAEQFTIKLLDADVDNHKLDELEKSRIAEYDSFKSGYNAHPGGRINPSASDPHGLEARIALQQWSAEKRLDRALSMPLPAACHFLRYSAKKRLERARRVSAQPGEIAWIKENLQSELNMCAKLAQEDVVPVDSTPRVEKFQMAKAMKRVKKLSKMSNIEAAWFLSESKRNVMKGAKWRNVDVSVERWYPNVLTKEEIRKLKDNGGSWPSSAPSPRASSISATQTTEDDESLIPSDYEEGEIPGYVPPPSAASQRSRKSEQSKGTVSYQSTNVVDGSCIPQTQAGGLYTQWEDSEEEQEANYVSD